MHGFVQLLLLAGKARLVWHPLACARGLAVGSTVSSEVDQTDMVAPGPTDDVLSKDFSKWEDLLPFPSSMAVMKEFLAGQRTSKPPRSPGKTLRSIHFLLFFVAFDPNPCIFLIHLGLPSWQCMIKRSSTSKAISARRIPECRVTCCARGTVGVLEGGREHASQGRNPESKS